MILFGHHTGKKSKDYNSLQIQWKCDVWLAEQEEEEIFLGYRTPRRGSSQQRAPGRGRGRMDLPPEAPPCYSILCTHVSFPSMPTTELGLVGCCSFYQAGDREVGRHAERRPAQWLDQRRPHWLQPGHLSPTFSSSTIPPIHALISGVLFRRAKIAHTAFYRY